MVIRFICPNGHPLSAPEDRAGKPARCPKCQTAFLVPDEEEQEGTQEELGEEPREDGAGEPAREPAERSAPAQRQAPAATPQASQDIIVFLCPNGHKLNGPASLKGRAGQCPHCKAKFVIPGDDEEEQEDEAEQEFREEGPGEQRYPAAPAATVAGHQRQAELSPSPAPPAEEGRELDDIPDVEDEFADEIELIDDAEVVEEVSGVSVLEQQSAAGGHALERLLAIFQIQGNSSVTLDLHLTDGQTVRASELSPALSQLGFAVCANQQPEDAPVISIIRWDDISRVTIRGLDKLPAQWS